MGKNLAQEYKASSDTRWTYISKEENMRFTLASFKKPLLVVLVLTWFSMMVMGPSIAAAALSPSLLTDESGSAVRQQEVGKIRQVLENKIAVQKLKDYGLNADEVSSKISTMSDDQIHHLASLSDKVTVGGDGLGAVIAILIIVLLVVLILKLWDKRIIVR